MCTRPSDRHGALFPNPSDPATFLGRSRPSATSRRRPMPLRLVQIVLPPKCQDDTDRLLDGVAPVGRWPLDHPEGSELLELVMEADEVEPLVDRFTDCFAEEDGFRVTLLPVEATLPHLGDDEDDEKGDAPSDTDGSRSRVSRDELKVDALESSQLTWVYLVMVAASTIVASVGLLRDDVAVIIGAMVIAPLLGPNVALALSAALADLDLAKRALVTLLAAGSVALAVSMGTGFFVDVDPTVAAIADRTRPGNSDLVLAMAAGVAGTLAFTSGFPQAVIGVMVAVALLPPLVIFGLLMGSGNGALAAGAFLLFGFNVISVNLAGVATFLVRGVRPAGWSDKENAKKSVRVAALTWTVLLLMFLVALWVARDQGFGPFAD